MATSRAWRADFRSHEPAPFATPRPRSGSNGSRISQSPIARRELCPGQPGTSERLPSRRCPAGGKPDLSTPCPPGGDGWPPIQGSQAIPCWKASPLHRQAVKPAERAPQPGGRGGAEAVSPGWYDDHNFINLLDQNIHTIHGPFLVTWRRKAHDRG